MRKSTRTVSGTALTAALGAALLLGGPSSLAFWSGGKSSATQQVQSGNLDLGSSSELTVTNATIKQCTPTCPSAAAPYTGGPIVPGDVITTTVSVPVTLLGDNLQAEFSVVPAAIAASSSSVADVALRDALEISATFINDSPAMSPGSAILTPPVVAGNSIPVVVEVAFPWGTAGQYNDATSGHVTLSVEYTLTQIAAE